MRLGVGFRTFSWSVALLHTSLCVFLPKLERDDISTPQFKAAISISETFLEPGDDVVLQFELTNENKEDYYILNWHTPFEGFASEFLEISYEGKPVPYKGILVKRGNPSAENYLPLLAESTISTLVVLNEVYDVSRPGVYCVKLDTALMDYKMKIKGKELQPTKLEDGFSSSIPLSSGCTLFVVEDQREEQPFKAEISLSDSDFKPGDDVVLQFEITNANKEDYYILDWHTPLEGFSSEFLEITRDGERVPYNGMLVKRGEPSEENYFPLLAGSTASTAVVLNDAYDVSKPGVYCVKLDTALMDFKMIDDEEEFKPRELEDGFRFNSIPLSSDCVLFVVEDDLL